MNSENSWRIKWGDSAVRFFFSYTFWTPWRIEAIPPEARELPPWLQVSDYSIQRIPVWTGWGAEPLTDSMQDIPFFMESVVRTETLETPVLINIKTSNEEYKKKTCLGPQGFFFSPSHQLYGFSLLFFIIIFINTFRYWLSTFFFPIVSGHFNQIIVWLLKYSPALVSLPLPVLC